MTTFSVVTSLSLICNTKDSANAYIAYMHECNDFSAGDLLKLSKKTFGDVNVNVNVSIGLQYLCSCKLISESNL